MPIIVIAVLALIVTLLLNVIFLVLASIAVIDSEKETALLLVPWTILPTIISSFHSVRINMLLVVSLLALAFIKPLLYIPGYPSAYETVSGIELLKSILILSPNQLYMFEFSTL